ncbi:eyes absent homolog isoform X2 [Macadamia integrifolia]|uniref:eyes absent homolog isoform X2 n=1 Tax=Macadamia integrifolia TaxID=60698 RepID=UPI001C5313A7|nr:eyes absent homolog isoform X2 [Macadamia integrifolia]
MNVFIWDMDETLILLKSLLNSKYAEGFNGSKDIQKGIEIGKMWEEHILRVCDDYFFYEEIEHYNKPCLDALSEYDDGRDLSGYDFAKDEFNPPYDDPNRRKLAYRHRLIADKYTQGLHNVLDQEMIERWDALYDMTDSYTDRWLSSARTFLEHCSGENNGLAPHVASSNVCTGTGYKNINVLVTSGSLIPTLVKCLLFRLDDLFTHTNVHGKLESSNAFHGSRSVLVDQMSGSVRLGMDGKNVKLHRQWLGHSLELIHNLWVSTGSQVLQ